MVCPLTLSLKTGRNSIVSERFFLEAHFEQFGVTNHQIAHDDSHLHDIFPQSVFFGACFLYFRFICVRAFLAVCLRPRKSLRILRLIVYPFVHAADNLCHIYIFATHTEIVLKEIGINHRACNTHRNRAYRKVRFSAHRGNG